eukprot:UN20499
MYLINGTQMCANQNFQNFVLINKHLPILLILNRGMGPGQGDVCTESDNVILPVYVSSTGIFSSEQSF